MNIAFITTVRHNIGDDFVREGLEYLLTRALGRRPRFACVHKHRPSTTRLGFSRVRDRALDLRLERLPLVPCADRILRADWVVQSGAPVFYCHQTHTHCADNEWFGPLVRRRLVARARKPFLNLAGGSAQRYHDVDGALCSLCSGYVRELHGLAAVTTVRDTVAQRALRALGSDVDVISCSSLFGPDNRVIAAETGRYVAVNYMPNGGHYVFGQAIDGERWRRSFQQVYRHLKRNERVVLVCHDGAEVAAASTIDPDGEIFFPHDDAIGAMRFYAGAKYGLMNRIHGAMMLAALGKPSVVVGTDTRAHMVDTLGLPRYFVEDATPERLLDELATLTAQAAHIGERLRTVKTQEENRYLAALAAVVAR